MNKKLLSFVGLLLVLIVLVGFLGHAEAQTDSTRYLAIEINPSDFPTLGNWSENYGSVGGPGEKWTSDGIDMVWSMLIQDNGEPRPYDVVNQIESSGNFDQYGCPQDGRDLGWYIRYVDDQYIPSNLRDVLDKIGWRAISAYDSENTWYLGTNSKMSLGELIWCSSNPAPSWVVDFNPSDVPYTDQPVEPFSGPQYAAGRVWDSSGWKFELVQISDNAWDWKQYPGDDVVNQWACPVSGGLGMFSQYVPRSVIEANSEISPSTLNEMGYVLISADTAYNTFHLLRNEEHWVHSKPIWCQTWQQPSPTPTETATSTMTPAPTATITPTATLEPTSAPSPTITPTQVVTHTLYLPLAMLNFQGKQQKTCTVHWQSGTRPIDGGVSPGVDNMHDLRFWVNNTGSWNLATWMVTEVSNGNRVLLHENVLCSQGTCNSSSISGTTENPRPAPGVQLLVTVQLYPDTVGSNCSSTVYVDPPQ
jgi:hypothetical protein